MAKTAITSSVMFLALVLSLFAPTKATVYVVGDALGWTGNILDKDYYTNWLVGKTFYVGDVLVYNCVLGSTLFELTKEVFESGSTTPYIHKYVGISSNVITLTEPGTRYFSAGLPIALVHLLVEGYTFGRNYRLSFWVDVVHAETALDVDNIYLTLP